jgi:hypothetical protein
VPAKTLDEPDDEELAYAVIAPAPATILLSAPEFEDRRRRPAFGRLLERLEPIEDRLYSLVRTEIYARAAAYVRGHPEEFVR